MLGWVRLSWGRLLRSVGLVGGRLGLAIYPYQPDLPIPTQPNLPTPTWTYLTQPTNLTYPNLT